MKSWMQRRQMKMILKEVNNRKSNRRMLLYLRRMQVATTIELRWQLPRTGIQLLSGIEVQRILHGKEYVFLNFFTSRCSFFSLIF